MKRSFRIICYSIVFLLIIFISNFNSTIEIETKVQPKFGACLDKFGGKVELVKTGNGNDLGGKATVSGDSNWTKGPVTYTVHALASSYDKIKKIHVRIYNSKGYECTDTDILSLLGLTAASYSEIKFKMTFSNKDMWQNIQVWQVDTNDQIGSKGHDEAQIDASKPVAKTFEVSKDNNNLKVNAVVRDHYSKLEDKSVILTISNPSTGYENIISNSKDEGDYSRSISANIPLSEIGSGDIKVTLNARDKVGNLFDETKTLTTEVNQETGEETVVVETTTSTTTVPPAGQGGSGGSGEEGGTLATGLSSIGKNNYEFTCDDEISGLIDKYWSYVLILGPILMLVMCTIEFVKALMASDADAVKKATSNTVKRTIAFVILMLLKVIMSVLFNFFGIQICW